MFAHGSGRLCAMWRRRVAGGDAARTPKQVWAEWMAANDEGDLDRADLLAAEMTRVAPDSFFAWFEAGLHAKARRNWHQSADWSARAMALFGDDKAKEFDGANPAAWNSPVLPLRDPHPDAGRRPGRRPRPGPCLVRRRTAHLKAIHRPAGRFSPLTQTTPSGVFGPTPSANSSAGSYPGEDLAPTPVSSDANTPSGTSNDPITATGPNPTGYPTRRW